MVVQTNLVVINAQSKISKSKQYFSLIEIKCFKIYFKSIIKSTGVQLG
jgi:hypothetical protein